MRILENYIIPAFEDRNNAVDWKGIAYSLYAQSKDCMWIWNEMEKLCKN